MVLCGQCFCLDWGEGGREMKLDLTFFNANVNPVWTMTALVECPG